MAKMEVSVPIWITVWVSEPITSYKNWDEEKFAEKLVQKAIKEVKKTYPKLELIPDMDVEINEGLITSQKEDDEINKVMYPEIYGDDDD